jgi:hypothetical protein
MLGSRVAEMEAQFACPGTHLLNGLSEWKMEVLGKFTCNVLIIRPKFEDIILDLRFRSFYLDNSA